MGSTVLHSSAKAIPIFRSLWQVAIRTNNVEPSSDNGGWSSSSLTACTKNLRMSSVRRWRSREVRKFLRRPGRFYAELQPSPILGRAVPTSQFVSPNPLSSGQLTGTGTSLPRLWGEWRNLPAFTFWRSFDGS